MTKTNINLSTLLPAHRRRGGFLLRDGGGAAEAVGAVHPEGGLRHHHWLQHRQLRHPVPAKPRQGAQDPRRLLAVGPRAQPPGNTPIFTIITIILYIVV